jgi:hypothetical protein
LNACEIRSYYERISWVFNSDSMNIGRVANLRAGGETAAKTAQSTYRPSHDTIRTQIPNLSEISGLPKARCNVETGPNTTVRVVQVVKPL